MARARLGPAADLPTRAHGGLPQGRRAARRRGEGVRGRGCDPLPHAGRGRDVVGRRRARRDLVSQRESRGSRPRPRRRTPDLQLRVADGGRVGRDHARDPRRGSRLEHAEADQHHPCRRGGAARVRTRAERNGPRRKEALEATRRHRGRRAASAGLLRARVDELPRSARLGPRRRNHDHEPRGAGRALQPRARQLEPRSIRLRQARLDERRVLTRLATGRVRGRARAVSARAGLRLGRGAHSRRGAARAGEDRQAR